MKKLMMTALAAALWMVTSASALTINDPGVVGTFNPGTTGNPPSAEAAWLQQLLDLPNSSDVVIDGVQYMTRTTPPDYSGTIDASDLSKDDSGGTSVPAGWEWVVGKYDGPNAGYVAWYIGGAAVTLPQYPAELFTSNPTQYELSHWTAFNRTDNPPSVPDGGSTVLLLGAGLAALSLARRSRK